MCTEYRLAVKFNFFTLKISIFTYFEIQKLTKKSIFASPNYLGILNIIFRNTLTVQG